jgi:ABC-type multidrug transport system ATPase subunit
MPPDFIAHAAVSLERVAKVYGGFAALRDVSVTLPAGASVVLLGENVAGKSTLLRLIAGLAQPSFGSVQVFGGTVVDARGRVATMGHATMLYDELTAMENLVYFAGLSASEGLSARAAKALSEVGLDATNMRRVGEYSQGMRQRAALARALMTEPDLLLLDEPFANLDVASAQAMIARLQQYLAQPGSDGMARTLVLTTHQAELARPLAQTTITLRAGRVEASETR